MIRYDQFLTEVSFVEQMLMAKYVLKIRLLVSKFQTIQNQQATDIILHADAKHV